MLSRENSKDFGRLTVQIARPIIDMEAYMDRDMRARILTKLAIVWSANPDESLFSLLAELCGGGSQAYILHTYADGYTDGVEQKTFNNLCIVSDDELEGALDDLIG